MFAPFAPFGEKPKDVLPKHNCCDNCTLNCSCGADNCQDAFIVEMSVEVELPGPFNVKTRPVSSQNKDYLKNALKNFRKGKINEQMNKLEQLVSCPNVLLELGDFFIAQVLEIATTFSMYRMFSVMLKCGVKNMQLLFSTSSVSVLEMLN